MSGSGYFFAGMMKKTVKDHRANPINRQPWTIKEATVAKSIIFYKKNFPERRSGSAGKSYPVWDSAPVRRVLKNPEDWNVFSYGYYDRRRKGICIFV